MFARVLGLVVIVGAVLAEFDMSVEPEGSDRLQRLENQLTAFAGLVQQMAQHQIVAIVALV